MVSVEQGPSRKENQKLRKRAIPLLAAKGLNLRPDQTNQRDKMDKIGT
jgi:hypothetical protein